jgi:3-hydroxyisobutyrate dehydrogenase-like beta-hydroxyacid dehydrogenase
MIERVGVIGLGKMGMPMVRHLLAKQHKVFAYDLEPGLMDQAAKLGATACADPAEIAAQSDLIIVIVGFDSEVIDVCESPRGILSSVREGAIIGVAATVAPETMQRLAKKAGALNKGIGVLDIPLCRGEAAAHTGGLLLLAGGDKELFEKCRHAFETFASDLYLLGGLGAGQVGKMVNNLLLWACTSANHEGLKLGEALGVDSALLREALMKSSGNNWALETWDQPRNMPWAEKDMAIVMQQADNTRLSLPLCGVVREVIKGYKIEKGLAVPAART